MNSQSHDKYFLTFPSPFINFALFQKQHGGAVDKIRPRLPINLFLRWHLRDFFSSLLLHLVFLGFSRALNQA